MAKLDIDTFGAIIDEALKNANVQLLVTLPEGTLEAEIDSNVNGGPVMEFYILLNAMKTVVRNVVAQMHIDPGQIGNMYDGLFAILKHDLMEERDE